MKRIEVLLLSMAILGIIASDALAQGRRGGGGGFGRGGNFGGGGGPSPERMFEYADRDRDGRLSPDELAARPLMAEMIGNSGIDAEEGVSRDDFMEFAPRMMEAFREGGGFGGPGADGEAGRDGIGRGPFGRDAGGGPRGPDGSGGNASSGSTSNAKPRVTLDLPSEYTDRDLDKDGQIALFEWRTWKRTAMAEFRDLDRNGDGFLTPRELSPTAPDATQAAATTARLVIVRPGDRNGRNGSRSGTADGSSRDPSRNSDDDDDALVQRAQTTFGYLDRDRDGQVTPEEWGNSRRTRPMFEQAGIDLSRPMSAEEFVQTHIRLSRDREQSR